VGAAAFHCYGGSASAMTTFHQQNPGVPIQMTECSDGAWHTDSFADMTNLIIDSTNNWSSSVVFWALALDPSGGPTNQGCTNCTALVTVDPTQHTVSYDIDFYIMGHASKYVLPGAKRIGNTVDGSNVNVATFVNTNGSEVALVYNTSGNAQAVSVQGSTATVNVKVAPRSFATVRLNKTGA
jgi:glucosylceramidase